eukprot:scaffold320105_cov38-Prasinocladus_malaysianus.AAC.1
MANGNMTIRADLIHTKKGLPHHGGFARRDGRPMLGPRSAQTLSFLSNSARQLKVSLFPTSTGAVQRCPKC